MQENSIDEGLISLVEFRKFLFDTIVPIEDVRDKDGKPISEMLFYWRKKTLVPFIPSGRHTFKVSFSDIIWFRILDILREFSYPEKKMKLVCDYFFKDAYFDELPTKNFRYNQQQLNKKKLAGTISEKELSTLDFIDKSLKDERFLYALRYEVNYLTNLITQCIAGEEDKMILIYRDGRVGELHGDFFYTHSNFEMDATEPCIQISLRYLFTEFVKKDDLAKLFLPHVLNEKEKNLLKRIKDKKVKEIIVKAKHGAIHKIEIKKDEVIKGEEAKKIGALLGLKNYEHISIKTVDGKSIYLETRTSKA